MPQRLQIEKLTIQYMAKPGQWVPVARVAGCKGPHNRFARQSVLDFGIAGNINIVVVADEIIEADRLVRQKCNYDQGCTNPEF